MAKDYLPKNAICTAVEYMQPDSPTLFQENI